jgi:predicted metalloprotease with PDZ domain
MSRIRYSVELKDLHGHRFEVSLHIPARILKGWGAQVQLPAWIPGSYMLRDFSKHIETISAKSIATKKNISLEKIDSNTWFVPPSNHDVTVSYQVYGFDTSVRAAYIDTARAFFNPSSLCLQVLDHADEVHELEILKPSASGNLGKH